MLAIHLYEKKLKTSITTLFDFDFNFSLVFVFSFSHTLNNIILNLINSCILTKPILKIREKKKRKEKKRREEIFTEQIFVMIIIVNHI